MRKDWIECELGEIEEPKAENIKPNKFPDEEFELYSVPSFSNGKPEISKGREIGSTKHIVHNNYVLLSRINPHLNRSWVINTESNRRLIASSEWVKFAPFKEIVPNFLKKYLQQGRVVTYMCANVSGVGGSLTRTNKNAIRKFLFPLPPLPEQRAIVAKIEELFSELDNGIANLKKAQQQLKVYRQAVLKQAFEGELTKEWRAKQKDLPSADELLEQIQTERQQYYEQQLEEWKQAVKTWEENGKEGKKPRKPGKLKIFSPVTNEDKSTFSSLPTSWFYTKQGNLIEEPKYGTSKKCNYNIEGKGVLRIPNISDGVISAEDLKFALFSEAEMRIYQLKLNDILTIRSNGSVDLVGKCAIVQEKDTEYLYAGYLIRLRPLSNNINSKFLLYCLSSGELRIQIESKAKSTSGVNNINSGELSSLIIPLCPLQEQYQIVQEIESRLSVCDKVEESIAENLAKAEALRQSILKKAFEGKLLTESELAACRAAADWEPASVLLERIQAEKAATALAAKEAKKKAKQTKPKTSKSKK